MKKYIIFLVFVVLLGFTNSSNVKAQDETCPGAIAVREAYFIFDCPPIPNCILRVVYCCYFDEINLILRIELKRIDFIGNGLPGTGWACYYVCYYYNQPGFWNMISQAIQRDLERNDNPCISWLPDCDGDVPIQVKVYRSQCWYYENFWFTKYEPQWLFVMRPCGSLTCIHEYKICKRNGRLVVTDERWTVTGPPECTTEEPSQLPPPGKTWEEYWRTDCFAKPCWPQ